MHKFSPMKIFFYMFHSFGFSKNHTHTPKRRHKKLCNCMQIPPKCDSFFGTKDLNSLFIFYFYTTINLQFFQTKWESQNVIVEISLSSFGSNSSTWNSFFPIRKCLHFLQIVFSIKQVFASGYVTDSMFQMNKSKAYGNRSLIKSFYTTIEQEEFACQVPKLCFISVTLIVNNWICKDFYLNRFHKYCTFFEHVEKIFAPSFVEVDLGIYISICMNLRM